MEHVSVPNLGPPVGRDFREEVRGGHNLYTPRIKSKVSKKKAVSAMAAIRRVV